MRLVVTGSRGFLGSVFSLRMAELGHEVLALDDESRGLNDVHQAAFGHALVYKRHDCLGGFSEANQGRTIDAVAHFAAATGSLERPLDELLIYNVEMLKRVYEDAVRFGAKAFIWPTTSLALGVPDSPYVISKEEGLRWLREADKHHRIATPVRFFNVAGAYKGLTERRKNEVHLIPEMLKCYIEDRPLIVNGLGYNTRDGSPSRDFVNVLDVVEYLRHIMLAKFDGIPTPPPAEDGAIQIGTGQATTVLQAIEIFRQYIGLLKFEQGPDRPFDCGALEIEGLQRAAFRTLRGGSLVPPWVSIRDELLALHED